MDRENCAWVSAIFECSGSIWMKKKATLIISEGSTILRGLAELCLIDQRCQTSLKSIPCGKASATPFCQHLSRRHTCTCNFLLTHCEVVSIIWNPIFSKTSGQLEAELVPKTNWVKLSVHIKNEVHLKAFALTKQTRY